LTPIREDRTITAPAQKKKLSVSLFAVYVAVAVTVGIILESSGILTRQELQTINRRFELRQWLYWHPESIKRLGQVFAYSKDHDWGQVATWLIENNHPPIINKIVIFNHAVEDEPPAAALATYPWMEPLLNYPVRRRTVGEMVEFLAKAGAAAIILDSDYPQYSAVKSDDRSLAEAIHNAWSGKYGHALPVYMVRAVNVEHRAESTKVEPTSPESILDNLLLCEPGLNKQQVTEKYTGMTSMPPDEDQVVRRLQIFQRSPDGKVAHTALVLKVLKALGRTLPADLPDTMDVDFAGPPKSDDLYPVRPLSYLLDPQQKKVMLANEPGTDISLKDAIVLIGDGINDVYNTPFTNSGLTDLMSGTEILANSLDTISRHSWPLRLTGAYSFFYMILSAIAGGALWAIWKSVQLQSELTGNELLRLRGSIFRLLADVLFFCLILSGTLLVASAMFAWAGVIVPVFVPAISLAIGTCAAFVWERERTREQAFLDELKSQQEKHELELEKFESEMARQKIEAENREMYQDRKRRHEFVRRINHDLNAPVTVLNWTISELQMMNLENEKACDKVSRLVKSSDKLCELIDQLVQSYDYEITPGITNNQAALCDLKDVLDDCVDGQKPLAEKFNDTLAWVKPENSLWVKANSLELSRVIDNIFRNAIKHNPEKTSVSIKVDSNGSFHKILISDNGKGIAAEHINHIFEPGYRVNPEKKDGHGLGLDIAKTLIEGMGGEISVSSTPGKGTTFQLKLPICPEDRAMHHDVISDKEILEADVDDSPALNARKKQLETANKGTGEQQ
jgi:signal transduction histidine kinase